MLVALYAAMFATVTTMAWVKSSELGHVARAAMALLLGATWPLVVMLGAYMWVKDERSKDDEG